MLAYFDMKAIKTRKTKQVLMTITDEGILHYVYHRPGTVETLEDAKQNLKAFFEFVAWRKEEYFHAIIDLSNLKKVEHGVRAMYRSQEAMDATGLNAIVTKNPISRMIGTFFLRVDRPANPTKLFHNESEALEWILQNRDNFQKTEKSSKK